MRFLVVFLLFATSLSAQTYSKGTFKHGDSLFWGSGLGDSIWTPSNNQTAVIIRDSSKFQTTLSVGTPYTTSPLTVTNFTTAFPTPQVGTMLHLVSNASTNGRLSFDTYNNASFTGSNFQGRRARGTAGTPLPVQIDDVLVAVGADGYGVDSFSNISVGSMNIRSEATFTNTSKPTYIAFTTTPSGSTTQVERMRIKSTGVVNIAGLNSVGFVQTDVNGNLSTGAIANGSISNAMLANGAVANLSGTNTGDNAVNSLYSGLVSNATHTGDATGSTALTVVRINGVALSGLGTGLLKNTTGTGVPSIAVSGTDVKTINGTSVLGSGDIGVSGTSTSTYVNLASPFSSTITTEATVTGWSFAVTSGKAYRIEVTALYQTAATTTGGELGFFLTASGAGTIAGSAEGAIVSTAAATSLSQQISAIGAADLAGSNLITTGVTAINSPHYIKSTVVFICTVSGTFNVGWASEVGGSASQLNAGSAMIYQVLN